jgi:septum formation protein
VIVWLASRSPRRRELLSNAGISIETHPSHADERRTVGDDPVTHALRLAQRKASTAPHDRVVVAADSVVHRGDAFYEIPLDRDEAERHLRTLSGGWHLVTTGVCVRLGARERSFTITTRVRFRALGEAEIARYLATGEADDKAGAYGIQGQAGGFVAEVIGSWTNVMGLPLEETLTALREFGVSAWGTTDAAPT